MWIRPIFRVVFCLILFGVVLFVVSGFVKLRTVDVIVDVVWVQSL